MPYLIPGYGTENATPTTANGLVVALITIPMQIAFTRFALNIQLPAAAGFAGIGIYFLDGHLLARSEAIPTDTGGVMTAGAQYGFTILPAGNYYWAWTCSDNTVQFVGLDEQPGLIQLLSYNPTFPGYGTCSSTSSAGILPATLGTITSDSGVIAAGVLY